MISFLHLKESLKLTLTAVEACSKGTLDFNFCSCLSNCHSNNAIFIISFVFAGSYI
jgi:hypothetical protein